MKSLKHAVGAVLARPQSATVCDILLIRKRDSTWSLPKGTIKRHETPLAALVREVAEETGFTGHIAQPLGTLIYPIPTAKAQRLKQVDYYLMWMRGGTLHLDRTEGIVEAQWVPYRDLARYLPRPRLAAIVARAQEVLGSICCDARSRCGT